MEHYEKKISFLGENIQTIRKHRGMKQQELADKIGINMQSLSKIERGVNYPTFDTLEKIMDVLGVTPNELLSGEWKYVNQAEKEVCQFLRIEERLNAELKHGHYDNFFDSEEEWLEYELEKLREYITDYINGKSIVASDLYPIKEFIQHLKFQKLLDRYDDLYSMDMFGESIEGHKYRTPYQVVIIPYLLLNWGLSFLRLDMVSYIYAPLCFPRTYPCCINHHSGLTVFEISNAG